MLGGDCLEKACLTQYVMRDWYEKAFLMKMLDEIAIKKARLTKNVRWDWLCCLFSMKMLDEVGFLTQYLRGGWHKKKFFAENDSRGMYVRASFSLIC